MIDFNVDYVVYVIINAQYIRAILRPGRAPGGGRQRRRPERGVYSIRVYIILDKYYMMLCCISKLCFIIFQEQFRRDVELRKADANRWDAMQQKACSIRHLALYIQFTRIHALYIYIYI